MSAAIAVSFELFPPSGPASLSELGACLEHLTPFAPRYLSVTCGADGSTRERTRGVVRELLREHALSVAPHITAVGESPEGLERTLAEYRSLGVRHLVVLRGDPPRDRPPPECAPGFARAAELVSAVQAAAPGGFEMAVAAYPEGHPESGGVDADIANLARKAEAGARRAITQFCFDSDAIARYRDACARAGVRVPIVPGVLPIQRFDQLCRFAARCGASIPHWLHAAFAGLEHKPETQRRVAARVAIEQIEALKREGFSEFHFYTLNRAEPTASVCRAVGVASARCAPLRSDRRASAPTA